MKVRRTTRLASVTVAVVITLMGCATVRQSQARNTGQLLAAAGFTMQFADTAARQQHLDAMPPYRLLSRTRNGAVEYTYADPKDCRCVYVGGSQEYVRYQDLAARRQAAREQLLASPTPVITPSPSTGPLPAGDQAWGEEWGTARGPGKPWW
jgi:hypothetical protein